ncbi:LysR substrate-binding domain-containing protein [Pseudomonas sp. R5(2019)]|uniref:LysR substrate-binding domain-containing protein n=1 Tax=Pseudomonas sp. R5(2019) TaxID=2697566 RepID=UPI00141341A8|nr:LysR substrate-binding domain-containing protein [Pseudomonas sp. R5(2019)]NBA93645.1 LysR family transcriptional regulator [Pseudomonas sp. R5(2019)]
MKDLNDLYYFVLVVKHGGFSAAARATGIEKTLLSRHIAFLEKRVGARLLHRTTRQVSLTEAGQHFYTQSLAVVDGAEAAYESVEHLRREPVGIVRLSCPQVMAQSYLSPLLPAYMEKYPKVRLELNAVDRQVDLFEERFDVALRARPQIEETAGLVAKRLGSAKRILVASPRFLDRVGRPATLKALSELQTLCRPGDLHDGIGRWLLHGSTDEDILLNHKPCLISDDLRMQLEAAVNGLGVALLPEPIAAASVRAKVLEIVMPSWAGPTHLIHLLYPKPKGMLPSVRSLIDYLSEHLPQSIQERSITIDTSV